MQPLQDDFRDPAAKDNSITNAATARSNFDAAIAIGSAETELQNTIELCATASEIVAPTPEQKKLILNRKWKQPNSERSFFCHMYAIRSWFLLRFVTTHTETKIKWHRHSAVCNPTWKAKLLKHSNSDSDAVHNNAHPALGSQTRVDPSAARPRTVAVQDVEPFCALSFGSVATQSVPETSAFSNGPNLNFWRSSHSPQVAAHLPPCSSDSPAPPWPCWTRNTTSHVQFREERKLLLWLLWSLGVNQLVTRRKDAFQVTFAQGRQLLCSSMQSWKKAPKAIINMLMATNLGRPVLKNLALLIRQHIFPPTEKVPSKTKIIVCIADTCLETCFETCFSHLSQVIFAVF